MLERRQDRKIEIEINEFCRPRAAAAWHAIGIVIQNEARPTDLPSFCTCTDELEAGSFFRLLCGC